MLGRDIEFLNYFIQSCELAIGKQFEARCFLVHLVLRIKYGLTNLDQQIGEMCLFLSCKVLGNLERAPLACRADCCTAESLS